MKRKDQKRLITVSSNVLESHNPNEVVAEIKTAMSRVTIMVRSILTLHFILTHVLVELLASAVLLASGFTQLHNCLV